MDIIEQMNWRYATKKMTGAKVATAKLNRILEAIRLSASAYGLQPYTILVVEDQETRKKLLPAAYNQSQITDASHLLVFAAWENITEEKLTGYIQNISDIREVSVESLAPFKNYMSSLLTRSPEENMNWAARQAYIALGTGLIAAAFEEVDATPMEGFNPSAFDEILNLKEKGLKSVAILALGYRDAENDPIVKIKKVRQPKEKLFIHI
jgi:nitroreductase